MPSRGQGLLTSEARLTFAPHVNGGCVAYPMYDYCTARFELTPPMYCIHVMSSTVSCWHRRGETRARGAGGSGSLLQSLINSWQPSALLLPTRSTPKLSGKGSSHCASKVQPSNSSAGLDQHLRLARCQDEGLFKIETDYRNKE